MFRSRTTRSYISQSQQTSQVIENYYLNILTISKEIQRRLELLEKDNKCLSELNAKKTELIKIMNGYLNQTSTRVETVTSLDALLSKIA
jgi:DNA repair ATPase RecN